MLRWERFCFRRDLRSLDPEEVELKATSSCGAIWAPKHLLARLEPIVPTVVWDSFSAKADINSGN